MTCQHTTTLGVYLLGALEPVERSEFESHLSGCDPCRGELVRLAPLPGLLNQITVEDFADDMPPAPVSLPVTEPVPVQQAQPEPTPEPTPEPAPVADLSSKRHRRARRYWRGAAAAAILVALTIGGILSWQAMEDDPATPVAEGVTWSGNQPDSGVWANARLVDHEWGTEIGVKVANLPPGRECYLIVIDDEGKRQVAGWWWTNHDPQAEIPAATSVPRSHIAGLEIKLDDRSLAVAIPSPPR